MSLKARLARQIAASGPITVAEFMGVCLHDPEHGYYATRPALGADGDFITAPLVSQMFGEVLGLWAVECWTRLGAPKHFSLIEMGPGDGTLMSDALRALPRIAPGFMAAADLWLVETSAPLRALQAARLADHAPRWAGSLAEVTGGVPMILIANELLDCLPARQFVVTARGWTERRVGLDKDGNLVFGLAALPAGLGFPAAPEGSVLEVSAAQGALGAEVGARVAADAGCAVFVDYGRDESGFGDTLQALLHHRKVDALATAGEADLTVHADFPAFAWAAQGAGAQASPIIPQSTFLARLGIVERAEALAGARPDHAPVIERQLHRLLAPDQMGTLFKAVAIHSSGLLVPGFED